ncbi:HD domain-containing protein [Christensenellaceae bacterium OttesenSCG-928-K19]|nr:HD domain-containing protein [Christensenellaceae bacterium OttesenSCG-928-K19]
MLDEKRLERQLSFLVEIDKMKTVLRRNLIADGSRRENDAEHSWHMAVMALVLYEYAYSPEVDLCRALNMTLLHDLVEVYAGDTFCYDEAGKVDKAERERRAADKLFALPPEEQGSEYRALWEEFDAMQTPDSIYAAAIDRMQPLLLNYLTKGHTWHQANIGSDKVYERMDMIKKGMPKLWPVVEYIVNDSIEKGFLKE